MSAAIVYYAHLIRHKADDFVSVGYIPDNPFMLVGSRTPPSDYLICDGSRYKTKEYPELARMMIRIKPWWRRIYFTLIREFEVPDYGVKVVVGIDPGAGS